MKYVCDFINLIDFLTQIDKEYMKLVEFQDQEPTQMVDPKVQDLSIDLDLAQEEISLILKHQDQVPMNHWAILKLPKKDSLWSQEDHKL